MDALSALFALSTSSLLGIPYWCLSTSTMWWSSYTPQKTESLQPKKYWVSLEMLLGFTRTTANVWRLQSDALTRKWTRLPRLASLPGHYLPLGLASLNPEASPENLHPMVDKVARQLPYGSRICCNRWGGHRRRRGRLPSQDSALDGRRRPGTRRQGFLGWEDSWRRSSRRRPGPGRGPVTLGEVFLEEKVLGAAVAGGGGRGAGTSPSMRSSSNRAFMEDSRVKARRRKPWSGSGRLRVFLDMLLVLVLGASRHGRRTMGSLSSSWTQRS